MCIIFAVQKFIKTKAASRMSHTGVTGPFPTFPI